VNVRWLALGILVFMAAGIFVLKKAAGKGPADLGSVSDECRHNTAANADPNCQSSRSSSRCC
jgi:hypothetical protein